jgi:activator of HSP90 ATPase
MEYSDSTVPVSQDTMPGGTITFMSAAFSAKEKPNQYFLSASEALASTRYAPFYEKKEIGSIEAISGNVVRLNIKD